jgi:hypothetical protein
MRNNETQGVLAAALGCVAFLLLAGCGQVPQTPRGGGDVPSSQTYDGGAGAGENQGQRQVEFLNRVRGSDPQYQTIQKAVLNENNQLGLILSRNVELDSIPRLMRAMLTRMASEFPGEDLTVIAYAPTEPPRRIGTAHLDARTRAMTYTPETPG